LANAHIDDHGSFFNPIALDFKHSRSRH
jgi:hypothetical protein